MLAHWERLLSRLAVDVLARTVARTADGRKVYVRMELAKDLSTRCFGSMSTGDQFLILGGSAAGVVYSGAFARLPPPQDRRAPRAAPGPQARLYTLAPARRRWDTPPAP